MTPHRSKRKDSKNISDPPQQTSDYDDVKHFRLFTLSTSPLREAMSQPPCDRTNIFSDEQVTRGTSRVSERNLKALKCRTAYSSSPADDAANGRLESKGIHRQNRRQFLHVHLQVGTMSTYNLKSVASGCRKLKGIGLGWIGMYSRPFVHPRPICAHDR